MPAVLKVLKFEGLQYFNGQQHLAKVSESSEPCGVSGLAGQAEVAELSELSEVSELSELSNLPQLAELSMLCTRTLLNVMVRHQLAPANSLLVAARESSDILESPQTFVSAGTS